METPSPFIKFLRILLLILIIIGMGLLLTINFWVPKLVNEILGAHFHPVPLAAQPLSELQAADLAEQAFSNAKITTLSPDCFSEDVVSTTTDEITFDIREVHNATCGGDPDTAPHLATVLVNVNTKQTTIQN